MLGVVLVAFPYVLRRWLGRGGALIVSFLFLISPSLLYYSRYIRHDIPAILFALGMAWALLRYLEDEDKEIKWLILLAATMSLLLASKEVAFIYIAIGVLLVAVPLAATSIRVANESLAELQTQRFAQLWLDQTGFEINRVEADGQHIEVIISGSGDLPALTDLGADLQSVLDPRIDMKIRVVPAETLLYPEMASG